MDSSRIRLIGGSIMHVFETCLSCESIKLKLLRVINPKTSEMNSDAVFLCLECGCKFLGITASDKTKDEYELGSII